MSREKQIEDIANVIYDDPNAYDTYWRSNCEQLAETIYDAGYRKQSDVIKEFVKRFEKYIGNCTFTFGQTNDIQYALKKATEEMIGE